MIGWRGRVGYLVPPGCPTVEGEIAPLMPTGVSAHFSRLVAHGPTGTLTGQEERNRSQLQHIDQSAELLAMVKPGVMVLAHTATSYTLGRTGETDLIRRMEATYQVSFLTAFGSVIKAFAHLGVRRIALGAPYSQEVTLKAKDHLEAYGIEVVNWGCLPDVANIYDETAERAYALARQVDVPNAEAVFLSGVGLPTLSVIGILEQDLGKPVISSVAAVAWASLRTIKVSEPIRGFGRLLAT